MNQLKKGLMVLLIGTMFTSAGMASAGGLAVETDVAMAAPAAPVATSVDAEFQRVVSEFGGTTAGSSMCCIVCIRAGCCIDCPIGQPTCRCVMNLPVCTCRIETSQ